MTICVAAYDPASRAFGAAVAGKFLSIGSAVLAARWPFGLVATQGWVKEALKEKALQRLGVGQGAGDVIQELKRDNWQIGVIDSAGRVAVATGKDCPPWSGHRAGDNYMVLAAQAVSEEAADRTALAFRDSHGPLPMRLLAAVVSGYQAGGDRRGLQSSALLVLSARERIDLRVDSGPDPLGELEHLYELYRLYNPPPKRELLPLREETAAEVAEHLRTLGYSLDPQWGPEAQRALERFIEAENLQARAAGEAIDAEVLRFLRRLASSGRIVRR